MFELGQPHGLFVIQAHPFHPRRATAPNPRDGSSLGRAGNIDGSS